MRDILTLDTIRHVVPEGAERIRAILSDAGYHAVFVGGCIRDLILEQVPLDWDIGTSAPPKESMELFGTHGLHVIPTGLPHGTITVLWDGDAYEVTVFREDGSYSDGRRPDKVAYIDDLEMDLSRRDFTINAMAWDPKAGLVDPYGGRADLAAKQIRTVGDPDKRFAEDALRMMRAIRFAARLGFAVMPETLDAIRKNAADISKVSGERISAELTRTVTAIRPEAVLLYRSTGLLKGFLPELDLNFEDITGSGLSVGEHSVRVVGFAAPSLICRMAALLHDVERHVRDGHEYVADHALRSAETADAVLQRLRFATRDRIRIVRLIALHDDPVPISLKEVRIWLSGIAAAHMHIAEDLRQFWVEWKDLVTADLLANASNTAPPGSSAESIREAARTQSEQAGGIRDKLDAMEQVDRWVRQVIESGSPLTVRDLAVDGQDAIRIGLKGTRIGAGLQKCLERVVAEPADNRRDCLLAELQSFKEDACG